MTGLFQCAFSHKLFKFFVYLPFYGEMCVDNRYFCSQCRKNKLVMVK